MYLKYLAVEGFKSFPEWNGLELMPGVNVLVGLNGTGKSNLTDAVSWVLGEEDRAALRAEGATALIFAGSEELVPTDTAHVTVVLDERPPRLIEEGARVPLGQLKHGQRATHTGVCPPGTLTITREFTRGHDDRFFVDGSPSSRDEVKAALADVGVPFPPVATIRQGELERLLVLDPVERARVVEQVVGIPELSDRLRMLDEEIARQRLRREHLEGEFEEASARVESLRADVLVLDRARTLEVDIAARRADAVVRTINDVSAGAGRSTEEIATATAALLRMLDLDTSGPKELNDKAGLDAEQGEGLEERVAALAALGPVTRSAPSALAAAEAHLATIVADRHRVSISLATLVDERQGLASRISAAFSAAIQRIDDRFRRYYGLLAPEGEAALRILPAAEEGRSGIDVVARPPGKILDRIDALSGGERSLAALSFALALFQEAAAPFFILDEVEPALDDTNTRRLQTVLNLVADQRQLLVVSHQQRAKETGDVVFGVERNLDGASQVKFRYEPRSRRLEVFRRTWAADNLRKTSTNDGGALPATRRSQLSVGTAGSPTQAVFAELFAPTSGANRQAFHDDGTFRGIWDAVHEESGRVASMDDAAASTTNGTRPAPPAEPGDQDDAVPPKCCC